MARLGLLLLLLLLPALVAAQEAPGAAETTLLGTVGRAQITSQEAEMFLAQTGGPRPGETPDEARRRAANELIAGHVVDRMAGHGTRLNPELRVALERQRRQMLLELHLRANIDVPPPAEEDIDAFIAASPELFAERHSYWFSQIFVPQLDAAQRPAFDAALAALQSGAITPERVLAFQQALMQAAVQHERRSRWSASEELGPGFRAALDSLHASDPPLEVVEREGTVELRLLFARFADPIDPGLQRRQVALLLMQRAVVQQRDALIAELAQEAQREAEARSVSPDFTPLPGRTGPQPGELWMFGVAGGLGLFLPLTIWSGRRLGLAIEGPARFLILPVLLGAIAATGWMGYLLTPALGPITLAALGAGGLVMGSLVAAAWARHLMVYDPTPLRDGLRFGFCVVLLSAAFGTYVAGRAGLI